MGIALITGVLRIKKLIVQRERAEDRRVDAICVDDQTVLQLDLLTELAGQSLYEVVDLDDALAPHQVGQIVLEIVHEFENVLALNYFLIRILLVQIAVRAPRMTGRIVERIVLLIVSVLIVWLTDLFSVSTGRTPTI